MDTRTDAAAFDSATGIGFDSHPVARAIVPPAGKITGAGPALAVNPAENNAFRAINRAWRAGASVHFEPAGPNGSGGRYVISGLAPEKQQELVSAFAISAERVAAPAGGRPRPRIGLFLANTSMDEGWTRWVLDAFEFEYVRVSGEDIQTGNLRSRIDVLVISDEARGVLGGGAGRGGRAGGAPATPAPQAGQTPDELRVKAIDEFVRGGGTLVCFNRSSNFAIDQLKLPVKNVVAGQGRQQFFVGGSLLNVNVDARHRVVAGMPERATVYYDSGPVFETTDGFKGTALARYPESEPVLASGFLQGEKLIQGKAAALDVELGDGHVILLGFRPQWRGQPFGTFRVIFNAIAGAPAIGAPR